MNRSRDGPRSTNHAVRGIYSEIDSGLLGPGRLSSVDRSKYATGLRCPAQVVEVREAHIRGLSRLVVSWKWEKVPGSLGQVNSSDLAEPLQARYQ